MAKPGDIEELWGKSWRLMAAMLPAIGMAAGYAR
jgi:hypothetical protein